MLVTTDHRAKQLLARIGIRLCSRQEVAEEVRLGPGQSWQVEGDNRCRAITCRDGRLSIIQQDDPWHYILRPGELFIVTRPGPVRVRAIQATEFQTTPPLTSAPLIGRTLARLFNPA